MSANEAFRNEGTRRTWNQGASAWEVFVESGADYYRHEIHGPALLRVCGQVEGLKVLDLGCGQGFFTRQLARAGAHVVGVDIAEEQLACARRHEAREPLGIEYRHLSAGAVHRIGRRATSTWSLDV